MLSRRDTGILLAAGAVFLFFAAAWIHLPGPQNDEFLPTPVVLPALRPTMLYSIGPAGRPFPLMIMSYVGALKGWLLTLWFLVVPMSVAGYRAFGIAAGLATLWLAWWLARRYWDRPVALLLVALLATDPSFVHSIRLDYGPVALAHLFKMGGLCLLVRWLDGGSRGALAAGMLLFGLGLWDKANFIWFLAGLGATVTLLFPLQTLRRLRSMPIALPALLLGAAPFLAFNLSQPGQTWQERGRFEIRWTKLHQAVGTLNGDFMSALAGEDELHSSPPAHDVALPGLANAMYHLGRLHRTIVLPLLGLALLLLPVNLWIGPRRALLFPLLLSLFTYACMFVTFDGGSSVHHVVMVQPFPLLFVAASLWTPVRRWPQRMIRAPVLTLVAAALVVNLSVNARHLAIYTRTGGTWAFTDAVYPLTAFLSRHSDRRLYALDWGFSNPVAFLGARSGLRVDDFFFSLNSPADPGHAKQVEHLGELMRDPQNLFLLHSRERTLFAAPAAAFYALAATTPMRRLGEFEERSGRPVIEVYEPGPAHPVTLPPEVEVHFLPTRARRGEAYLIEVRELANQWIDLFYHVDQSAGGTALRFCKLDAEGRATQVVPRDHPAATVRITQIRPSGGQWRPARGEIRVVE